MVGHGQRIAELDAEKEPSLGGGLLEGGDQLYRTVVVQVVFEHGVGDVDVAKAKVVVKDAHHRFFAQQRRIQLDDGMQAPILQQVAGDLFDLIGGTAVHGRQGNAVGQPGGDVDTSELGKVLPQDVLDLGQFCRGVFHPVHEADHGRALDAFQVVADTHVKDGAKGGGFFQAQ